MNIEKLYLLDRRKLAYNCLCFGLVLAFFTTMHAWPLWPIENYYMVASSGLIAVAMLLYNPLPDNIFSNPHYLLPSALYFLYAYYNSIVLGSNAVSYIANLFLIFIFFGLFKLEAKVLMSVIRVICKVLAVILIFSIPAYLYVLSGHSLPCFNAAYGEAYSFTNYILFLDNDSMYWSNLFPRFSSIFLEPGHLGSVASLLLATQFGQWKRWYNLVILAGILITFSLAAYVMLITVVFLNLWIRRKKIVAKLIVLTLLMGIVVGGAFVYNNGDNLLHDLILIRLEIEDGQMEGDNRNTDTFLAEYDNYLQSSDILFGRKYDEVFGNAGFRVFVYQYGIVGLLLFIMVYSAAFVPSSRDRRTLASAMVLSLQFFIVRAFMFWPCIFLPLYCLAMTSNEDLNDKKELC